MLVCRYGHRAGYRQGPQRREQAEDQQPAADQFGEAGGVGEEQREGQMQRRHIGFGELLGIGQLFLAVVDHQHADGEAQQQQGRVGQGPIGQEVGRRQAAERSRQVVSAPQPEAGSISDDPLGLGGATQQHEPEGDAGGQEAGKQLEQQGSGHGLGTGDWCQIKPVCQSA